MNNLFIAHFVLHFCFPLCFGFLHVDCHFHDFIFRCICILTGLHSELWSFRHYQSASSHRHLKFNLKMYQTFHLNLLLFCKWHLLSHCRTRSSGVVLDSSFPFLTSSESPGPICLPSLSQVQPQFSVCVVHTPALVCSLAIFPGENVIYVP